jgi:hypothetical protein
MSVFVCLTRNFGVLTNICCEDNRKNPFQKQTILEDITISHEDLVEGTRMRNTVIAQ